MLANCTTCAIECRASLLSLSPENVSNSELHKPRGQVLPQRFPHSVEIRWCVCVPLSFTREARINACQRYQSIVCS